jgi:hypothetical protein
LGLVVIALCALIARSRKPQTTDSQVSSVKQGSSPT